MSSNIIPNSSNHDIEGGNYVLFSVGPPPTLKDQLELSQLSTKIIPYEEEIRLVNLVKKYPILYVIAKGPASRTKSTRENLWQSVAKSMEWTVEETKRRWKSLRDRYAKEKRLQIFNETSTPDLHEASTWVLSKHLSFLSNHIKHRSYTLGLSAQPSDSVLDNDEEILGDVYTNLSDERSEVTDAGSTTNNLETPHDNIDFRDILNPIFKKEVDSDVEATEAEQEMSEPEVTESQEPRLKKANTLNSRKRKRKAKVNKESDDIEDAILKTLNDLRNENRVYVTPPPSKLASVGAISKPTGSGRGDVVECMDEDEMYCMSIASEMRRMTDKQKSYAKMVIQKTLFEVKFGHVKELEGGTEDDDKNDKRYSPNESFILCNSLQ